MPRKLNWRRLKGTIRTPSRVLKALKAHVKRTFQRSLCEKRNLQRGSVLTPTQAGQTVDRSTEGTNCKLPNTYVHPMLTTIYNSIYMINNLYDLSEALKHESDSEKWGSGGASTIQKRFSFPQFTSPKISFLNRILNRLSYLLVGSGGWQCVGHVPSGNNQDLASTTSPFNHCVSVWSKLTSFYSIWIETGTLVQLASIWQNQGWQAHARTGAQFWKIDC
jgi:hypothetical protein